MFTRIMVPVDLEHVERLGKALGVAMDLAKHYGIPICYVGVTAGTPGAVAHTPEEYAAKLEAFRVEQASGQGIEASCRAIVSTDPTAELDEKLLRAVGDIGADVVVMGSHVPGLPEHIFASNAGYVAAHAPVSVFVIR